MRVLILSPFFYPELIGSGRYNTKLADGLVKRGCQVTVFTCNPIYPEWQVKISNEQLANIKIIRGGAWLRFPSSVIIRRAILEIWFSAFVFLRYLRFERDINLVVSIYPPSLFSILLNFILNRKIIKVSIIHDLQSVYAQSSSSKLKSSIAWLVSLVERRVFNSCDRLIFLSRSMAKEAIKNYKIDPQKVAVCYPFPTIEHRAESIFRLDDLLSDLKLHIIYSGALGEKQNPEILYQFLNNIALMDSRYQCHIFSAGPVFEKLKILFSKSTENLVAFHGLVSDSELHKLYEKSYVQVIPQASEVGHGSLPSKLPNILFSGTPIFAICDSDCEFATLIREIDGGGVGDSWDLNILENSFKHFTSKIKKESISERRLRLRPIVEKYFSLDLLLDNILLIGKDNE
ncbi:glycosyltransferase family 4 protein [Polynucleobacter paneuropaeus]|nr:glycosyltransferase family 4 protein [Polynucleobacter paneuropaeus]MBT8599729.1 glycosyltransferase family 4 protein [Polynucleobacter paneuropaeus]